MRLNGPDEWAYPICDEPVAFVDEPDTPDSWVWSCDEPDESINPAQALIDTDF